MTRTIRTRVGAGGRIVIPAEFRERLGLAISDAVNLTCDDGEVRLSTRQEDIRRVQQLSGSE